MAKWVKMDPETLDEVDTAMVHFWAEEGDGTLWSLDLCDLLDSDPLEKQTH